MSLKKKCDICGYRFKRFDSAICPECLTSREDTVNCSDFAFDMHSHNKGFSSTFQNEEKSDFLKELESEKGSSHDEDESYTAPYSTNSDSYYEETTYSQSHRPNTSYNNNPNNQRLSGNQWQKPASYYSNQNTQQNTSYNRPNITPTYTQPPYMRNLNQNNRKNSSSGCATAIVITIVIGIIITSTIMSFTDDKEENLSHSHEYNSYDDSTIISNNYMWNFNTPVILDSANITIGEPELLDNSLVDTYPNFADYASYNDGYWGDWYFVSIPITIDNMDKEYFDLYNFSFYSTCYKDTYFYNDPENLEGEYAYFMSVNNNDTYTAGEETYNLELIYAVPDAHYYSFGFNYRDAETDNMYYLDYAWNSNNDGFELYDYNINPIN